MKLLTIGGLLVEIMREQVDKPFTQPHKFIGPFPSGDVAIFIHAAAKLGNDCTIIGKTGDDDFGLCIITRLKQAGVNVSAIQMLKDYSTGTAFVAYFKDGSRKFIYHWEHAAAGMLNENDVELSDLAEYDWVHITGINLGINENCKKAIYKLVELLPAKTTVSFDPNIRPEILSEEEIRKLCAPIIKRASYIFPSNTEARFLTGCEHDYAGCKHWAGEGKVVVLKRGSAGCSVFYRDTELDIPSFQVEEVDPTGAGDSFCAGFVSAIGMGKSLAEAGRFANAVGALSVTQKGPMEGACTLEQVERFITESDDKRR